MLYQLSYSRLLRENSIRDRLFTELPLKSPRGC